MSRFFSHFFLRLPIHDIMECHPRGETFAHQVGDLFLTVYECVKRCCFLKAALKVVLLIQA